LKEKKLINKMKYKNSTFFFVELLKVVIKNLEIDAGEARKKKMRKSLGKLIKKISVLSSPRC
jgi:hypothetical protein